MKRLYDWVISWAYSPYGSWALFILAFTESSFFPIPPDVLLIALAVGRPAASLRFALICSAGSVLGACLGYLIGWQFMAALGNSIVDLYGLHDKIAMTPGPSGLPGSRRFPIRSSPLQQACSTLISPFS